ncbi:MAG: TraR/DksA family transcriptional regulator, partial [Trebonia sp.]
MEETRARTLLTAERDEVRSLLKDADNAVRLDREAEADDVPGDFADAAQPLGAEAGDEDVQGTLRDRLEAIERALSRLDDGTYGRSVRSGVAIPDERLEADPAAELTVEEARADEARLSRRHGYGGLLHAWGCTKQSTIFAFAGSASAPASASASASASA